MKKIVLLFILDWLDTKRRNCVLRAMVSTNEIAVEKHKAAADTYEEIAAFLTEIVDAMEGGE